MTLRPPSLSAALLIAGGFFRAPALLIAGGFFRAPSALVVPGVLLASGLLSCARGLIPNTDVDDTPDNRAVVEFCEAYRLAVEQRDIRKLMSLAHPNYYEDGGSVDATDDLDYAGLQQYLERQFVQASSIRYEVRYRKINRNEKSGWNVAYSYSASYRLPTDGEPVWHREVAENQLELVPDGESFRILSGM